MKDAKVSQPRLDGLHPNVKNAFKSFIETCEDKLGITLRIVQGMRSITYQDELYAQGRTKPGKIVTNAKGGSSFHNYGLAVDLVRMNGNDVDWNYDMSKLVPYMPAGMVWGGNFKSIKDKPHFEITFGLKWQTLFTKFNTKDFIPGTEFVNIGNYIPVRPCSKTTTKNTVKTPFII